MDLTFTFIVTTIREARLTWTFKTSKSIFAFCIYFKTHLRSVTFIYIYFCMQEFVSQNYFSLIKNQFDFKIVKKRFNQTWQNVSFWLQMLVSNTNLRVFYLNLTNTNWSWICSIFSESSIAITWVTTNSIHTITFTSTGNI